MTRALPITHMAYLGAARLALDRPRAVWHLRDMRLSPRLSSATVILNLGWCALLPAMSMGCGSKFVSGDDTDAGSIADATTDSTTDDGAVPVDSSTDDAATDAGCTPNLLTCAKKCGTVIDNCGQPRDCSKDCGQGSTCNGTTNKCECTPLSSWCASKCGSTKDNCGNSTDCGQCPNGLPCVQNTCNGCVADLATVTCKGRTCGSATNNCGQQVACGTNGTTSCASTSDVCAADGACCTPDNAAACTGKCGVSVVNNCGQTVSCPATCAAGSTCKSGACCFDCAHYSGQCGVRDDGCGSTVVCGCTSPRVCSNTMTKAGGTCCLPPKSTCSSGTDCCSGSCTGGLQTQSGGGTPTPIGGLCD